MIKLLTKTIGLIIIFSMIILNFDLIYEQKFDEVININIDNSDIDSENDEELTQKKLIEIKSSYERRIKKNKTELDVNDFICTPFCIWNMIYLLIDFQCTICILSLLYFFILYVEVNMFINFIYISLVIIFYFRVIYQIIFRYTSFFGR